MKASHVVALVLLLLCSMAVAADLKAPEKISMEALQKDCQRSCTATNSNGEKGMYFVWYIPVEFWQATLAQNPNVTKKQADNMVSEMKEVTILAVTRAQILASAKFEFYDEATVRKNLTVQYASADGKTTTG